MRNIAKIASVFVFMLILTVSGLPQPQASSEMMETKMTGMLTGAGNHQAAGMVAITKDKNGNPILTITDAKIDNVPDGRVYLAKDGDYTKGVELGKLTQFSGNTEYPIPSNVNPQDYNSVVIWCKKFSVEIGHAFFGKAMVK